MSLSWQHCTHLYYSPLSFSLSDCSSTRDAFVNAHTHIQEYLDCGQSEGGVCPSLSLIGLDHDISLTGVSFVEPQSFWVADTFFSFLEWLDAPVRPGIFVSHTREKLGRTLEPWYTYINSMSWIVVNRYWFYWQPIPISWKAGWLMANIILFMLTNLRNLKF